MTLAGSPAKPIAVFSSPGVNAWASAALRFPGVNAWAREKARRGMTLIELLVVVSIVLILTVAAIPALRPALEGRQIREAARAVNVYLSSARNRAQQSGRPFGVEMERDPNMVLACRTMYQVEVPSPYAGAMGSSVLNFAPIPPNPGDPPNTRKAIVQFCSAPSTPPGLYLENPDAVSLGFAQAGDELLMNYKPPRWRIMQIEGSAPNWIFTFYVPTGPVFPSPPPAPPLSNQQYQVFRRPVRSHVAPLQLPRGVVIDLLYSGFQNLFLPYDNSDLYSVAIMFNSHGGVDRIYATDPNSDTYYFGAWRAISPGFLLIGRRDRIPIDGNQRVTNPGTPPPSMVFSAGASPAEDGQTNLQDLANIWVAINSQTGFITSAEVASGAPSVSDARSIARQFQAMGGR